MKKKLKLFMTIASLCLAIGVLSFGVFSAINVSYNIGGTISYDVTDVFVKINTRVYSIADQKTEAEMQTDIATLSTKSLDEIDSLAGYTKKQTMAEVETTGDTTTNFQAQDLEGGTNVKVDYAKGAYTYYIVTNIQNLSPSKNVFAYLSANVNLGTNANTNFATNKMQNNIAKDETKNLVFGFSLADAKIGIADGVTFSCPITVDYEGIEDIPTGMKFTYFDDNLKTVTLRKYSGTAESMVIPKYISKDESGNAIPGRDYKVTQIFMNAFANNNTIKSVVIPDTIVNIGDGAFGACSSLESVELPDTIDSINGIFIRCAALKSITIPKSITSLGKNEFDGCTSLTAINLPSTIKSISYAAFTSTPFIDSIPADENGLKVVSAYDDSSVKMLLGVDKTKLKTTEITAEMLKGIKKIFGSPFKDSGITSIVIPSEIAEISSYAFYCCITLTTVTISSGVKLINAVSFDGCNNLTSVTFESTDGWFEYTGSYIGNSYDASNPTSNATLLKQGMGLKKN